MTAVDFITNTTDDIDDPESIVIGDRFKLNGTLVNSPTRILSFTVGDIIELYLTQDGEGYTLKYTVV